MYFINSIQILPNSAANTLQMCFSLVYHHRCSLCAVLCGFPFLSFLAKGSFCFSHIQLSFLGNAITFQVLLPTQTAGFTSLRETHMQCIISFCSPVHLCYNVSVKCKLYLFGWHVLSFHTCLLHHHLCRIDINLSHTIQPSLN